MEITEAYLVSLVAEMKVKENVEVDIVTGVECDVCLCSIRANNGDLEFATIGGMGLVTMASDTSCICAKTASFKQ